MADFIKLGWVKHASPKQERCHKHTMKLPLFNWILKFGDFFIEYFFLISNLYDNAIIESYKCALEETFHTC